MLQKASKSYFTERLTGTAKTPMWW